VRRESGRGGAGTIIFTAIARNGTLSTTPAKGSGAAKPKGGRTEMLWLLLRTEGVGPESPARRSRVRSTSQIRNTLRTFLP
jgi:hypothetical protein